MLYKEWRDPNFLSAGSVITIVLLPAGSVVTNGTTTIRDRAANLNSNSLNSIIFAELEKRQLSSSSLIERITFIDSNLLKRTLLLIFRYRMNDCKFAIPVPILHYFAFHSTLSF